MRKEGATLQAECGRGDAAAVETEYAGEVEGGVGGGTVRCSHGFLTVICEMRGF